MRKLLLTLAAVLLVGTGFAPKAEASNIGLGFLWASHPVGVFFKINDRTTAHVALSFGMFDAEDGSGDLSSSFGLAGAIIYDIWTGDCWGFGFLPGIAFTNDSFEDFADGTERDSETEIHVYLWLMGHWDPCEWLSFWFGHGLTIDIHDEGDESFTDFFTEGASLGSLGFTVWLP
jgi:hypothetical protein